MANFLNSALVWCNEKFLIINVKWALYKVNRAQAPCLVCYDNGVVVGFVFEVPYNHTYWYHPCDDTFLALPPEFANKYIDQMRISNFCN